MKEEFIYLLYEGMHSDSQVEAVYTNEEEARQRYDESVFNEKYNPQLYKVPLNKYRAYVNCINLCVDKEGVLIYKREDLINHIDIVESIGQFRHINSDKIVLSKNYTCSLEEALKDIEELRLKLINNGTWK